MADMERRRSLGGNHQESRKRKFEKVGGGAGESDNGTSSDFPCSYCSAVFVTQISLSRHVLAFHDTDEIDDEDAEVYESFEASESKHESGYYANNDEYFYMPDDEENDANLIEEATAELPVKYEMPGTDYMINTNGQRLLPQTNVKAKISTNDLATVLSQVDEITANATGEFVTCPLCNKTFGKNELSIHVQCEHGGAKFACPYCGRNISRRDHLKRHIKNVHPDKCTETEIGPFPRNLNLSRATNSQKKVTLSPNSNLVTQQTQEDHKNILPISIMTPRIRVDDEDDEEDDFEGEDDFQGNSLQSHESSLDDQEQDSTHITVEPDLPFHDLNDMDYNDDEYNTPNFIMDLLHQSQDQRLSNMGSASGSSSMGVYRCCVCSASFASKVLLDRHESTHGELRPHKCSVCGKGFLRKEHLSKHLSSVHSGMKFTCEFCGKDISRKDHLIRHIRNVHPNQFYSLSEGEQGLLLNPQQQLSVSVKAAQSMQPKPKKPFFSCDMCEATFVNVDDLHAHQATVHSDVRKYKCNYCCKAFKRKEHLAKHEVLHTGERKFTCRVCSSDFPRKDALHEHIRRIHGGLEDISNSTTNTVPCNLCDQLFPDRGSLLSHMTTVHGLIVNSPPGLPKSSQQQRLPTPQTAKAQVGIKTGAALPKPMASINANNLGSLMDLINKGSITLSFH